MLMEGGSTRIAVVTGANKGIGLEVVRQLAGNGLTVVLTARNEARGLAAVEKLKEAGISGVIYHQLEISDAPSIARLADFLKTRFGKLDILVNNAAVGGAENAGDPTSDQVSAMDEQQKIEWVGQNVRETFDSAKEGVQTNYYGTKQVIQALLPLLKASPDGRIVNVSSEFGLLRFFNSEEMKQELNDVEKLTEERLDEMLAAFLRDFEAGALVAPGWPIYCSAYKVAKAALNAYSRMLARKHPELRVNCIHPGYVKTDLTMNTGMLTPEQGAGFVAKVALLPQGGPTGTYFSMEEEAPFV